MTILHSNLIHDHPPFKQRHCAGSHQRMRTPYSCQAVIMLTLQEFCKEAEQLRTHSCRTLLTCWRMSKPESVSDAAGLDRSGFKSVHCWSNQISCNQCVVRDLPTFPLQQRLLSAFCRTEVCWNNAGLNDQERAEHRHNGALPAQAKNPTTDN